jgi:hypothetical protein
MVWVFLWQTTYSHCFSSYTDLADIYTHGLTLALFLQAYNLSRDHKPDLEIEKERILKAGGFIHAGRINGSLNLARAIGNLVTYGIVDFFID